MEAGGNTGVRSPRKGRVWAVLGAALCVIFGFILVCNLTIIIKGTMNPERPPSLLGVTPMVVLSGSMSGTQEGHIEAGDLILVKNADPNALEVGDVIAYMSGRTTLPIESRPLIRPRTVRCSLPRRATQTRWKIPSL